MTKGWFASPSAVPGANPRLAIIVAIVVAIIATMMGWLCQGCGRTSLLATDARESLGTQTATSTVIDAGGTDASSATSQPTTDGGCAAGFTVCGRGAATRCYDLSRSVDHCGQCENACAPGIACQSSRCQQYQCKGALTFKVLPAIPTVPSDNTRIDEDIFYYRPVLGDFDGDGTLDFVGQPEIGAPMGLLLGKGDGTFQTHAVASAFSRAWSAAAADLNGDGRLDLASITENKASVTVRLGNGDPATLFEPATTHATPSPPGSLLLADLDDDGHVDLLAAETQRLTLWRGAADGRLAEPVHMPVGLAALVTSSPSAYFLLAADWNRDGVLDLLFGTSTLRILLGRGDGTFGQEITCGLALDENPFGNILADFDHDQKLDMVVGAKIFLGMNGCNFSTSVSLTPQYTTNSPGVADLDGDGHLDIITTSTSVLVDIVTASISVYLGDGRGGFASPVTVPSFGGAQYGNFLVGDLNHDTKLDIINTQPGGWQVLLNTCP